jgi:hypothetical protein
VDIIARPTAQAFIAAHHYLPTYPAARLAVGLFGKSAQLEGVAVFAVPPTNAVITRHTGFAQPDKGCVLARLVLLDSVPQNGESFFCSRTFGLLRQARPTIEAVVAYSDPEAGHIGRVYAAPVRRASRHEPTPHHSALRRASPLGKDLVEDPERRARHGWGDRPARASRGSEAGMARVTG